MTDAERPERPDPGTLPDPVVSPSEYDEQYFRQCCAGHEAWTASNGAEAGGRYRWALEVAQLARGEVVVDVGTGRGELLAVAVKGGAARAVGVEYSTDGVDLAKRTVDAHGVAERARVIQADARAMPIDGDEADLVTLLDVVEHLSADEFHAVLKEALRVLRPGGRVLIHTAPNRLIYDVTYRFQRGVRPARRRDWPADPRGEHERSMHVNEQTLGSLEGALERGGFSAIDVWLGSWIYTDHIPEERATRLYRLLARLPVVKRLAIANLWGRGWKRAQ